MRYLVHIHTNLNWKVTFHLLHYCRFTLLLMLESVQYLLYVTTLYFGNPWTTFYLPSEATAACGLQYFMFRTRGTRALNLWYLSPSLLATVRLSACFTRHEKPFAACGLFLYNREGDQIQKGLLYHTFIDHTLGRLGISNISLVYF